MYVHDANLTAPPEDASLWRYQNFERFMQLLESGTLWFARTDRFSDRFEVAVPARDRAVAAENMLRQVREPGIKDSVWTYMSRFAGLTVAELDALPDDDLIRLVQRFANRFSYVSSWHRNDSESAGLWAQYTAAGNGVAIRTTAGKLQRVLDVGSGDYQCFIGEIRYLDYRTESWGPWHQRSAAFHKRRSFAYEQEVRAVIGWPHWDDFIQGRIDPASMPDLSGLAVPVDVPDLVEAVLISPNASPWFPKLVAAVMRRYGLQQVPVMSELTEAPDW
jgi:hypothetical protein